MISKQTTREKGDIGEDIACLYLEKLGFIVIERNHLRKWGEIDIVVTKDKILHFIEVKSTFCDGNAYRPEENVHDLKQRKLRKVIQTYLNERKYGVDTGFTFNVVVVSHDVKTGKSKVNMIENVIL